MGLSALAALAVLAFTAPASATSNVDLSKLDQTKYFTIKSVEVKEIPQPSFSMATEPLCNPTMSGDNNSAIHTFSGIDLGNIINMGKQIWTIIQENQPVVNVSVQKANALPTGVSAWTDLECWQVPESKLYSVVYTNLYGMKVVNIALRVNYTYGGRVNGMGRYLSEVTVLPAQLDVAWAFKVNADVKVANVTNAGTRASPIGGIQLDVHWTVSTPI
jgi:hypothetical protein